MSVVVRDGAREWRYELPRAEALRLARRMRAAGFRAEVGR